MVIGIFVPDGIGIKNYLYTDFPDRLLSSANNRLVIFHIGIDLSLLDQLGQKYPDRIIFVRLPAFKEDAVTKVLRESVTIARLKYFSATLNNKTILKSGPVANTPKRKLLLQLANLIGTALSKKYTDILRIEQWFSDRVARLRMDEHENFLQQHKIDILISLHQRPPDNIPIYEAARRLGIKRIAVIYSWDNVSKARLYTPAEKYFLWSRYMFDQMQLFYPEIPKEKLCITGTPQFSFYYSPAYLSEREDFCRKHGIDPKKPYLIFSGSDERTAPYDPHLLRDVALAVLKWNEAERPQLIFRRSPADFTNRYHWVFEKFPWIIVLDPKWQNKGAGWGTAIPTKEDIEMIVGLIQHGQLIINVASTMALDAATHDKPCIYISYNPKEAREAGYPPETYIHQEDHFKVMRNIDAVHYVNSVELLDECLQKLMNQPDAYARGRKRYLEIITNNLSSEAAANMVREIERLYEK
jgi:hypothetical protein